MGKPVSNTCVVCRSDKENLDLNDNPTLFKFPTSPERRRNWLKILSLEENKVKKTSRLCSRHFKTNQFIRLRLKTGALPSVEGRNLLKSLSSCEPKLVPILPKDTVHSGQPPKRFPKYDILIQIDYIGFIFEFN